jgi:hypothetical protein
MGKFLTIGFVVLTVLVGTSTVDAQMRGLGRIEGSVADDGGAPVEGVVVKLALGDGSALEGKSDAKGNFVVAGVGRGEFAASFTKDGFTTKRLKLVLEKEIGRSNPIKVQMKKGAA